MNAINETTLAGTSRQRFEDVIRTSAPYIDLGDFQLSTDEEYDELLQGIENHKYWTNEAIPFEISLEDALFSWYENVYHPITRAMEDEALAWSFPSVSRGELFLWVTRHWHFLKEQQGREVGTDEAVRSFGAKFGVGALNRFRHRVKQMVA
jgi:hypothetical protein